MKTYCSEEMVGYPEIVEWVPADVARELLDMLGSASNLIGALMMEIDCECDGYAHTCGKLERNNKLHEIDLLIEKACGES